MAQEERIEKFCKIELDVMQAQLAWSSPRDTRKNIGDPSGKHAWCRR